MRNCEYSQQRVIAARPFGRPAISHARGFSGPAVSGTGDHAQGTETVIPVATAVHRTPTVSPGLARAQRPISVVGFHRSGRTLLQIHPVRRPTPARGEPHLSANKCSRSYADIDLHGDGDGRARSTPPGSGQPGEHTFTASTSTSCSAWPTGERRQHHQQLAHRAPGAHHHRVE